MTHGRGESYSADMVTAAPGDPEIPAAPVDRIYFADEHTAVRVSFPVAPSLRRDLPSS
jgi:hypothetical protein